MSSKNHIIFQWTKPQEVSVYEADVLRRRWKKLVPVVLFSVAIAELIAYIFIRMLLQRMSPENIDSFLSRFAISLFGGYIGITVLVLFLYFDYPSTHAKAKCSYQITEKGIQVDGRNLLYRWKKIKGFWLIQHEHFDNLRVLNIRWRRRTTTFVLPKGEDADQVVDIITQRINLITDPLIIQKIKPSKAQHMFLSIFTIGYVTTIFYCFISGGYPGELFRGLLAIVFIVTLYIGPGTIGLLALYKNKFFKNHELQRYALPYNFAAVGLVFLVMLVFSLHYLAKQAL
jgi:hypothetical protein